LLLNISESVYRFMFFQKMPRLFLKLPSSCTVGVMNFRTALIPAIIALVFIPALAEASTPFSSLSGATATNTLDNTSYAQEWDWSTLSGGAALTLTSSSTAATDKTVLDINSSGFNSSSGRINYGIQLVTSHASTNSTNYGIYATASQGTAHNYGIYSQINGPTSNVGDAGIWGQGNGSGTYGVYGTSASATGYAGYFDNSAGGYAAAFMGGNVGIGTATPLNLLDVYGGGGIHISSGVPSSTTMALYNNSGTLTWNGIALATGSSVSGTTNYIPVFTGSNSLGDSVIYQSGSNVGIGTATPQSLVHAYGGEVQVGSSGASCASAIGGAIRFSGSTLYYCDGTSTWQTVSSGGSQWTTSGSNIYYSTGNVGIGTSNATTLLQVGSTPTSGNACNISSSGVMTNCTWNGVVISKTYGGVNQTAPTTQIFTSGSGTYTTPAGVVWLKVRIAAGGGGGGGVGSGNNGGAGGTGGNTTFGTSLLTANGGAGGANLGNGAGGTASGGNLNLTGSAGGPSLQSANTLGFSGGYGGSACLGIITAAPQYGGAPPYAGSNGQANSSAGGSGAAGTSAQAVAGGGGGGGCVEDIITSPSATYSYAVGAGGTAGTAGTSGAAGGTGGSGWLYVEEHYNY
jgi:hypothetical protein